VWCNANLVITIKASRKLAYTKIDTWQQVNDRAHCTESLSITKTTQGRVKVTGPLRSPFDALFDRAPTIPAERGVLADQVARLSSTEENIQTFQVWENMATGFGLPSKK
jgi:hypothetical protein